MSVQVEQAVAFAGRAGFLSEAAARRIEAAFCRSGPCWLDWRPFAVFLAALGKIARRILSSGLQSRFRHRLFMDQHLARAAPLLLAALCVALPARLGLVIIGGEGAIVLGGVAAGVVAMLAPGLPAPLGIGFMAIAAMSWAAVDRRGRGASPLRGVNETISSLLMAYIAIALMNHLIEGPFRDPASLNKPSTAPLPEAVAIGEIPGMGVHWGLAVGILACLVSWVLIERTTLGFAAGSSAATPAPPKSRDCRRRCCHRLHGSRRRFRGPGRHVRSRGRSWFANASLAAGYGYTGILIAFLARHNGLAIIPAAILLAGFEASSGLVQRRMDLPDATVLVLEGMVFIAILLSDSFQGRLRFLAAFERRQA